MSCIFVSGIFSAPDAYASITFSPAMSRHQTVIWPSLLSIARYVIFVRKIDCMYARHAPAIWLVSHPRSAKKLHDNGSTWNSSISRQWPWCWRWSYKALSALSLVRGSTNHFNRGLDLIFYLWFSIRNGFWWDSKISVLFARWQYYIVLKQSAWCSGLCYNRVHNNTAEANKNKIKNKPATLNTWPH